jgi:hypothetical protein
MRKYSGNILSRAQARMTRFPGRSPATPQNRRSIMIKLGRVSKETRGVPLVTHYEDLIFKLDGENIPKPMG